MYSFYETIKKEVDLQDLAEYLNEPLEKLKLLQIKLQEYKNQNLKENKIEIEELIRETDKLEKSVFPDLISNYCKLSLEFRNNNIIKEGKDKSGNKISYTSKDLLLKNIAKLIEHIDMLDEKFYTYFSFDFLVNSRIISDLGYQENFIDDNQDKERVVLKNKYVFSKEDARKIIDQQLGVNNQEQPNTNNIPNSNLKPQLQLKKDDDTSNIEEIFNKKQQDKELANAAQQHSKDFEKENVDCEDDEGVPILSISLIEILLVVGFLALAAMGVFVVYSKVSAQNEKNIAFKAQQEKILQLQAQSQEMAGNNMMATNQIIQELNANKEKNSINYQEGIDNSYKQVTKLMNKSVEFKQTNNSEKNELNYMSLIQNGYTLNEGDKLADNNNILSNNQIYTLNMKKDKVEVQVSNVFKNECQYMGIKLSSQYEIKVNNKELTPENTKQVCELSNTISILEK